MPYFARAARLGDVPPGTGCRVQVAGNWVAIFNVDGTIHAIDDRCMHQGGPLGKGKLKGCVVRCPWHMWGFDVRTGRCLENEELSVARHPVEIDGDEIRIEVEL